MLAAADEHAASGHRSGLAIERRYFLSLGSSANSNVATGQARGIERVHGLAQLSHNVVGYIYHI
jgi:hypothetical protein